MLEEGSGPDQDFHIMVLVLVRKKKVNVGAAGKGLGMKTAEAIDLGETSQHREKANGIH